MSTPQLGILQDPNQTFKTNSSTFQDLTAAPQKQLKDRLKSFHSWINLNWDNLTVPNNSPKLPQPFNMPSYHKFYTCKYYRVTHDHVTGYKG